MTESLNQEQLQFFFNEVLSALEWSDEIEETGVDPLKYVLYHIGKLRKNIRRLSGVSSARNEFRGRTECKNCNHTGSDPNHEDCDIPCEKCGGTGYE